MPSNFLHSFFHQRVQREWHSCVQWMCVLVCRARLLPPHTPYLACALFPSGSFLLHCLSLTKQSHSPSCLSAASHHHAECPCKKLCP
jgi:hypothetical protein